MRPRDENMQKAREQDLQLGDHVIILDGTPEGKPGVIQSLEGGLYQVLVEGEGVYGKLFWELEKKEANRE
jgi:ribosomal protein L24